MLRKLFFLILLVSLLFPFQAHAQEDAPFTSVSVQLWPEFDRPSMLVMYVITPSPQIKLPTEIRVRIPAVAGKPNAVATCETSADTPCNNAPFTQQPPEGEWSELIIPITLPSDVRIEFYDPRLDRSSSNRSYKFLWPGDHPVDNFIVQVQQPLRASDLRIKPGTVQTSVGQDGMNYYSLSVGSVPMGQTVELLVEYTKDNDELSNTSLPVAASEPLDNPSSTLPFSQKTLTALLALLGALLIVGGGVWYWISGRRPATGPERRRRTRRKASPAEAAADPEGSIYCHQCGHRATPGDVFCRICGTPLRKS